MNSINNFFLSRFKELNRTLRRSPRPTHREEVSRGGAATNANGHAVGPGFRLGHGAAIFLMLMSHELIFIIYSYVNNELDGLFFFITYFVVKYSNIFYLSCKDLSDRIRKFTPTVFFLCRNRYHSTDP
jgi:hypothetical protein